MAPIEYKIQRGDMLKEIAARNGLGTWELARANGIENPDLIHTGDTLVIPNAANDAQDGAAAVDDAPRPQAPQPAADPPATESPENETQAGQDSESESAAPQAAQPRAQDAQPQRSQPQSQPQGGSQSRGSTDRSGGDGYTRGGTGQITVRRAPAAGSQPTSVAGAHSHAAAPSQPAAGADLWARYGVNEFELEVVRLVNEIRRAYGLPELDVSISLLQAARGHATHMARQGVMAHDGIGDGTAESRVRDIGFMGAWGENVARGQTSPAQVVREWMASASHRDNILDPRWNLIAVELAYDANGQPFWAQNFGQR